MVGFNHKKNISVFYSLLKIVSKLFFRLQIHFLDFNSQAFFYFAHYGRPQRFLAGTGGFSRKKILFCLKGPVKLCLQINFLSLNPFFRLILMFLFRYCILW